MPAANTVPALLALRGRPQPCSGLVEPTTGCVVVDGRRLASTDLQWDVPELGCVYGTALNFRSVRAALESSFNQPPHNAPPQAPVLYIKPRNTWLAHGLAVRLPDDVEAVEVGATLGIRAYINGELRMRASTADLHRDVPQLIADVTGFMTLRAGDLLTVGIPAQPPLARAGDRVAVEIDGLGRLENELVAEGAP